MEPRYTNETYDPILYTELKIPKKYITERKNKMEKPKLMITETKAKKIMGLIKRIRITREEWCSMADEAIAKLNTYKNKEDNTIIIEALQHFLWEEEEELETMYEHKEKENNDKTD